MKRRGIAAASVVVGVLAVAACGSSDKQSAAATTVVTTTATALPPTSTAPTATETSGLTPSPSPAHSTARPTAPATPAAHKSPTAAHPTSTAPGPTANPPAGTPWAWSPNTPPSCTPKEAAKPGAFIQNLLVRSPVDNSHPWNGWVGEDNACFAYAVGVIDPNAKTIQLLVMDTDTRAQKAFTGHLGDAVGVGRFTIKIMPSSGMYGATLFEPGFYWN